jgi:hypothetical protein
MNLSTVESHVDDIVYIKTNAINTIELLSSQTLWIIKLENEDNSYSVFLPKIYSLQDIEFENTEILK